MNVNVKWVPYKIRDLGRVVTGKTPPTARSELFGDVYPFITPTDIDGNCHTVRTERFLSEEGRRFQESLLLPPNTISFVSIGATIGKICLTTQPSFTNQQINSVIVDQKKFAPRFVYYSLINAAPRIKAMAGGAATPIVNKSIFSGVDISVPPLPIQRKIAAILSAYDDLIENNTRRIKILEEMAQAIYREWFVNFRFPGHEKVKMVDSPIGKIPEGWAIKRIGERFTTVLGGTPSREKPEFWANGTIPWINSGKVNEMRVLDASELITEEGLRRSSAKLMPKRTTLVAITGATLGQISLLEIEACANQSVVGIYDQEKIFSEFIYLFFHESISAIIQHASGGAQQHINKEIVNAVQIILPPFGTIQRFNSLIQPIFDLAANLLWKNKNLRQTRDQLLPKLISGELDVSELDIKINVAGNG